MDLEHALTRRESARRRDLFEKRFDVRAEELERAVTALADEMEMAGMSVRMLEAKPPFAEIDLPGNAGFNHPLQRAVNRGAADSLILPPDQIDQIFGGEVTLLPQKDIDDEITLARALAAGRP
jgi:hypothetical protein